MKAKTSKQSHASVLNPEDFESTGTDVSWFVTVRLAADPISGYDAVLNADDPRLQCLTTMLELYAGVVSASPPNEIDVTIAADGYIDQALQDAIPLVAAAARKSGLRDFAVVSARMANELDAFGALDEGVEPRFLSVSEIARMLDVSRQMVSKMMKNGKLPKPVCRVGQSPGFARSDIERLIESRNSP